MGGKVMRVTRKQKPLGDLSTIHSRKNVETPTTGFTSTAQGDNEEELLLSRRLLYIRSQISTFTDQVNDLVSQAIESKCWNTQGKGELESFIHFLEELQASLKPWIPKLKEAVACQPSDAIDLSERSTGKSILSFSQVEESGSPACQGVAMESLVSPSPLVCWKGNNNLENGKQLFLLTPLPMTKTTRCQYVSESINIKCPSHPAAEFPSLPNLAKEADLLPSEVICRTPKLLEAATEVATRTSKCGLTSTTLFSEKRHLMLLRTPLVAESRDLKFRKSTPFPAKVNSHISESSSSESSGTLCLKYPELLGVRKVLKPATFKKKVESSPEWSSHSCNLNCPDNLTEDLPLPSVTATKEMANVGLDHCHGASINNIQAKANSNISESSSNDSSETLCLKYPELLGVRHALKPAPFKKKVEFSPEWSAPSCNSNCPVNLTEDPPLPSSVTVTKQMANIANVESTPLWKEPQSIMRTGKQAGESTLKKELWTRFEAASFRGLQLNISTVQRAARKGFLDMLDEVSEESPPVGGH